MVSQVQVGIRSIADDDNELSNKATEEIKKYEIKMLFETIQIKTLFNLLWLLR